VSAAGEVVESRVNGRGYLDVEHEPEKPDGVFRIGFFGDSYVEARQVRREATFSQQVQQLLEPRPVECFAFGRSGLGTVHCFLLCQKEMDFYDLDMVVYVFSENDLGDQIREIKRDPNMPYARWSEGRLDIDTSFREANRFRRSWPWRFLEWARARSLLLTTVEERIGLLLEYGVKMAVPEEERRMATRAPRSGVPNQNDLPSTWPPTLREQAIRLGEAVISRWRDEVERSGRIFAIQYVPREGEWQKPTPIQDSWKAWLESVCQRERIHFIDPTDSFFEAHRAGERLYDDHFTESGHRAFARAFARWFEAAGLLPKDRATAAGPPSKARGLAGDPSEARRGS